MKPWRPPSGRQRGLSFLLPEDWTAQQALAVLELIDDLRDRLCAHYQIPLQQLLREERTQLAPDPNSANDKNDTPF